MSSTLTTRIAQEYEQSALSGDDVASRRRRSAIDTLRTRGLPGPRDENWKYANLRPLERVRFAPAQTPDEGGVSPAQLPDAIENYVRCVFVDGTFAAHLSTDAREISGVTIRSLRETPRTAVATEHPDARFALVNEAFASDGALITASPGADCADCVEIVFIATAPADRAASYPRIELHAGERSRLGVIERHLSLGSEANFINCAAHVSAAAGARVDHYRVQQTSTLTTWIDTLAARIGQDAAYQLHLINLGGGSARSTLQVRLEGERARFDMHCVSVAERQQVQDVFALVDHVARDTASRQTFRGIAAGRSRVACNSKVIVHDGARGADSHQNLRGLLAGTDAEIDVRPQLEIYTDEVRCAHGATAGKLDEAMLFYLLSRGIQRDTAQLLLKWAFLEDVVSRVAVPELRRQIEHGVAGRMSEAAALAELL